jgi:hypothetical protein
LWCFGLCSFSGKLPWLATPIATPTKIPVPCMSPMPTTTGSISTAVPR